jgi:hypothetical protein
MLFCHLSSQNYFLILRRLVTDRECAVLSLIFLFPRPHVDEGDNESYCCRTARNKYCKERVPSEPTHNQGQRQACKGRTCVSGCSKKPIGCSSTCGRHAFSASPVKSGRGEKYGHVRCHCQIMNAYLYLGGLTGRVMNNRSGRAPTGHIA